MHKFVRLMIFIMGLHVCTMCTIIFAGTVGCPSVLSTAPVSILTDGGCPWTNTVALIFGCFYALLLIVGKVKYVTHTRYEADIELEHSTSTKMLIGTAVLGICAILVLFITDQFSFNFIIADQMFIVVIIVMFIQIIVNWCCIHLYVRFIERISLVPIIDQDIYTVF